MRHRFCQLEFGVHSLTDIRFLWTAWQSLLVREGLEATESSLVHVIIEDRLPGATR